MSKDFPGRREQIEACRYLISICSTCRHYGEKRVNGCVHLHCRARDELLTGEQMREEPGWRTCCESYAPDERLIREAMANKAAYHDREQAALCALLTLKDGGKTK